MLIYVINQFHDAIVDGLGARSKFSTSLENQPSYKSAAFRSLSSNCCASCVLIKATPDLFSDAMNIRSLYLPPFNQSLIGDDLS